MWMWGQKLLPVATMKETSLRRKPPQRGVWNQEINRATQLECQSLDQTIPESSTASRLFSYVSQQILCLI